MRDEANHARCIQYPCTVPGNALLGKKEKRRPKEKKMRAVCSMLRIRH
jgi:hypothetical protein